MYHYTPKIHQKYINNTSRYSAHCITVIAAHTEPSA